MGMAIILSVGIGLSLVVLLVTLICVRSAVDCCAEDDDEEVE